MDKEAAFYKRLQEDKILCELCPHNCKLSLGQMGLCKGRKREEDKLYAINYGEVTSMALDPIEKKPLYHFKPGNNILSVGSFGCNFKCGFCQNHTISQDKYRSEYVSPQRLIELAEQMENNIGIAFTYNEPSIWYEYIRDVCDASKNKNLDLVMVSNGYISTKVLKTLLPYISAFNIDLKAFKEEFYKKVCLGEIETVLNNIKIAAVKCHVEITTLLINEYNDSEEEVEELCKWIASVSKDIPLHFSRYYPTYKFKEEATPVERVIRARKIGKKYLNYVYIGNLSGVDNNTYCPKCGELLVKREGYFTEVLIQKNQCPKCQQHINVVIDN